MMGGKNDRNMYRADNNKDIYKMHPVGYIKYTFSRLLYDPGKRVLCSVCHNFPPFSVVVKSEQETIKSR